MTFAIERSEADAISRSKGWVLVYGRRKTGKTFLLKTYTKWDTYYLVRKDGNVSFEEGGRRGTLSGLEVARTVGEQLASGKTVIVDEFQRLPSSFLDEIGMVHPKGRLVLAGSSFRVMKEVFGRNSPVLGLFAEHKIGLVKGVDILKSLGRRCTPEATIEFGTFVQDPWLFPHLSFKDSPEELFHIVTHFQHAITGLVGEVFQEEERSLTQVYEAVLRLLGAGYNRSEELASILKNRGVLANSSTSAIIPFINNMEKMDLVEEFPVWRSKRKKAYALKSPIFDLFYYLADRHEIEHRQVTFKEARESVLQVRNLAIQRFVGHLFAETLGGRLERSYEPEIDIIVTRGGRPVLVGEVKWGRYDNRDVMAFQKKVDDFDCRKVLVVRKKGAVGKGIDVLDAGRLVKESTRA